MRGAALLALQGRALVHLLPFLVAPGLAACSLAPLSSRGSFYRTLGCNQRAAAVCSASSSSMDGEGKQQHCYPYPRPSLTVDAVIVAAPEFGGDPHLLLIQRKHDPYAGAWALPGGFVEANEPLETAAARELEEETGVKPQDVLLTQVGAFGDPGRDPRGWCVSVAFAALVPSPELGVQAADDAQAAQWYPLDQLPRLAFDHKLIVRTAFRHLAAQGTVQQQRPTLVEQLEQAADRLEGPWQQQ